jgi:hypothetical protein
VKLLVLIQIFFGFSLYALQWDLVGASGTDLRKFDIRDNHEIRELYRDAIGAPTSEVLKLPARVLSQRREEHRVSVEVKRSGDAYYILFINEEEFKFPLFSRGSWIIKRDLRTGEFIQAKIFFHSDPGSFVRIFPAGERAFMDVYLLDRMVHRRVPVGRGFFDLLTDPFESIVSLTRGTVDWETLVPPVTGDFSRVKKMVETIRPLLPKLPDAEDGAMDENGRLVYIDTLSAQERLPGFNCSGFAKWVADGLYAPRTGRFLKIDQLKVKPLDVRGNFISRRYETERDPYFGLDWSRNIAAALAGLDGKGLKVSVKSQDIRDLPYWKYREDIGFSVPDIRGILYYLTVTEPGNFYIGSVNREFGKNPVLRQHIHVVVLFPYFDEKGVFQVSVMERNVETGIESLNRRYRGDFIHLVRVRAAEDFTPPVIE